MDETDRTPRRLARPAVVAWVTVLLAVLGAGCAGGSQPAPTGEPATQPGGAPAAPGAAAPVSGPLAAGTVTVSAAASLTDVFGQLQKQFEATNPGVTVRFNFGASSDLAQQVVNGAPVDVLATANTKTMDTVRAAGLVAGQATTYTTNKLQIAVAAGNPKSIGRFADLGRPDLKVVVCAPQVPCGTAEKAAEKAAGATLHPVSEEPDVRAVLSKVVSGDADAGVVYLTDVRTAADKVTGINFAEADDAINVYPIATMTKSSRPDLANAWVSLVTGPTGRQVLRDAGFGEAPH